MVHRLQRDDPPMGAQHIEHLLVPCNCRHSHMRVALQVNAQPGRRKQDRQTACSAMWVAHAADTACCSWLRRDCATYHEKPVAFYAAAATSKAQNEGRR